MCSHDSFEIVYYKHGVMMRRCTECGQLEVRMDYIWEDAGRMIKALAGALEAVLQGSLVLGYMDDDEIERVRRLLRDYADPTLKEALTSSPCFRKSEE